MNSEQRILSANLHVYGPCNYRCAFCFDRCLTKSFRRPEEWTEVLEHLKDIGVTKINLAGGEPTLYPFLDEMVDLVLSYGFTVSIVSNGSLIDESFLKRFSGRISWIGLSIDSPDEEDEIRIGRHSGAVNHVQHIKDVARMARMMGYKVKLNITVIRDSWSKDFRPLLEEMSPDRVKVFRALTLRNANDDVEDVWSITDEQFSFFKSRHQGIPGIVFEDNDAMVASYLMFDPMGKWMVDKDGEKRFLPFDQLVREGLESMVDVSRYYARNAVYEWRM